MSITASHATSLSVLTSFTSTNGSGPASPLVQARDTNLYGTCQRGGTNNNGTVFSLTSSLTLTVTHNFSALDASGHNTDGSMPNGPLVQGFNTDNNLYGTTQYGGANGYGTIFKITPSGVLTTLHSFTASEGVNPVGGVVEDSAGNLYCTTQGGGANNYGTIFKLNSVGFTPVVLHSFNMADGMDPQCTLLYDSSAGYLYGTAFQGGADFSSGTLYKIKTDGSSFTVLNDFGATKLAYHPGPGVIAYTDTSGTYLYGVSGTGTHGGTIFKTKTDGTGFSTLYSFAYNPTGPNPNGIDPRGTLVVGYDGLLYGVTYLGGTHSAGVLYKITTTGSSYTVVYNLGSTGDPSNPNAGMILLGDHNLYGTSATGGTSNYGTIFKLIP